MIPRRSRKKAKDDIGESSKFTSKTQEYTLEECAALVDYFKVIRENMKEYHPYICVLRSYLLDELTAIITNIKKHIERRNDKNKEIDNLSFELEEEILSTYNNLEALFP